MPLAQALGDHAERGRGSSGHDDSTVGAPRDDRRRERHRGAVGQRRVRIGDSAGVLCNWERFSREERFVDFHEEVSIMRMSAGTRSPAARSTTSPTRWSSAGDQIGPAPCTTAS